jgi:cysteine desulfurase
MIYLDNNATTKIADEVFSAMKPFLKNKYANPSSVYSFALKNKKAVDEARQKTADLLNCRCEDIIFTSGGTESDNLAIKGILKQKAAKRKHFITSKVEHPAISNQIDVLKENGYKVTQVPVDSKGNLDIDFYENVLDENTALVSFMTANNETGVIFPVEKLAQKAREKGAFFHTDAVQAAGKIDINLAENSIDLLSLSGHKIHAPKGIGVLYKRNYS